MTELDELICSPDPRRFYLSSRVVQILTSACPRHLPPNPFKHVSLSHSCLPLLHAAFSGLLSYVYGVHMFMVHVGVCHLVQVEVGGQILWWVLSLHRGWD